MEERIDALPDSRSLWAETAEPSSTYKQLAGAEESDVAIVGAGFTGLSAALHLAKAGTAVSVIDAKAPGWGASGRNGGQVIAGLKYDPDTLIEQFGRDRGGAIAARAGSAPDLVFDLIQTHQIACDARRDGWLQAAVTRQGLATIRSRAQQWMRRNVRAEILDKPAVDKLTGTSAYLGGWIDYRGGIVHPLKYANGLARAAQECGAALYGHSPVRALVPAGAGWRVVTDQGHVDAKNVILATNGYTTSLWPGLRKSILPMYSFQIATEPLGPALSESVLPSRLPVSDTRRLLLYYRYDADGRFVMGGRGPFKEKPGRADARPMANALYSLFPVLKDVSIRHYWSGRIAMTLDHLPHLHGLAPGVYTALGYNGRGVAMATVMGKLLGDLVANSRQSEIPFPVTGVRPIPFHAAYRPAMRLFIHYYRARDRLDQLH